ncbi:hypothetical protein [Streptomyces himalayensis]|uniref:Uncharacterized protein n=1 Tax=Streptomyces himalayensis subsp. himalayensis TaxID=2756131 RepID=A0A7W0IAS7_9ACTN|nr:hypothetical protein [Streptomyces himalayensis]MBA2948633.1 hypothetical protein [Streptomyces himalayensis subsp. himalayensis]
MIDPTATRENDPASHGMRSHVQESRRLSLLFTRKLRAAAVTSATVGVFLLVTATPASAANRTMWTNDGDPGGYVYFDPYGDIVIAHDSQNDGKDVHVTVWDETKDPDDFRYDLYTDGDYDGSNSSAEGSWGVPYDLAEGNCIKFRVRLVDENDHSVVVSGSTDYAQWRNNNTDPADCSSVE